MSRRRILAILRIAIGVGFLWSGGTKLADEDLLYGGLLERLEQYGAPFPFYLRFIHRFVFLHQELFAHLAAIGEILVGMSFLMGALVSLGALGGAFLVLNFGFAISYGQPWRLAAHLAGAAVFLALGRAGAGLSWGLDGWLARRIHEAIVLFPLRRSLPPALRPAADAGQTGTHPEER